MLNELKEKLMSSVYIQQDNCWIYTGYNDSNGYGQFQIDGIKYRAHVASYLVYKGLIPQGMYVCHTCDKRDCINPEHLFLGTHEDNIRDMWQKGRGVLQDTKGINNGQAKLTEDEVREIKGELNSGYSLADVARFHSVDISCIWKIRHNKTWRHIT